MTKVMKKFSAMLLSLALVVTMMPFLAVPVNAESSSFGISVNRVDSGNAITTGYLLDNSLGAQVFPFPAKKGGSWSYIVADGASFEYVLADAFGLESFDDLDQAKIDWYQGDAESPTSQFSLTIPELLAAKDQFKLVDQAGNDITGAFNGAEIESAEAVAIEGAAPLTPVIAFKWHEYPTYEAAESALGDGTWTEGATEGIRAFVGGDLSSETFLKKDGKVNMGIANFTGKYAIAVSADDYFLDINVPVPEAKAAASMEMTVDDEEQLEVDFPENVLCVLDANWVSSDYDVVDVDDEGGILAIDAGKAEVALEINNGTKLASWNITVKAKPQEETKPEPTVKPTPSKTTKVKKPAVPKKFKVKNVKKKSAKLTWKKVKGASGYIIYRSTKKNKGFKKIKTIKKGKTVKFVNKKLKKGKTYYYKIKAFKKVNGKKVKGKFTKVKKVKIKK